MGGLERGDTWSVIQVLSVLSKVMVMEKSSQGQGIAQGRGRGPREKELGAFREQKKAPVAQF